MLEPWNHGNPIYGHRGGSYLLETLAAHVQVGQVSMLHKEGPVKRLSLEGLLCPSSCISPTIRPTSYCLVESPHASCINFIGLLTSSSSAINLGL